MCCWRIRIETATAGPKSNDTESVETVHDLLVKDCLCWPRINQRIDSDDTWRERILWELHFKRLHNLNSRSRRRVIRVVFRSYRVTADIRFFNEYLFFSDTDSRRQRTSSAMYLMFSGNLRVDGTHRWHKNGELTALTFLDAEDTKLVETPEFDNSIRVGLLGSPHFFSNLKPKLDQAGLTSVILFIPHHSSRLVRFLYNSKFLFKVFLLFKNIRIPYEDVSGDYKRGAISKAIRERSLDIAFHKLGFIIKDNIINSFPLGVINDHWGPLPEVRGRSSLEYTLIFGFPVVVTTHFITEKVDDGEIISFFDYRYMKESSSTVEDLKGKIRGKSDERAARSITLAISKGYEGIYNDSKDGLMFYAMHPRLVRYVDSVILRREPYSGAL